MYDEIQILEIFTACDSISEIHRAAAGLKYIMIYEGDFTMLGFIRALANTRTRSIISSR